MPRLAVPLVMALLLALPPLAATPVRAETLELSESVVLRAAAVAETPQGFVGSTATITVTAARNGTGHIFLDTFPLTEIDMQGSARLAARVASQVAGKDLRQHDFFFVIRSNSQQIGGPSAGATMAVGAIAALSGWAVRPDVLMTGTIQPDGTVGPVGGIPEKAQAAAQAGMNLFLFPSGEEIVALSSAPTQPINLTDYCASQLGITCAPVTDIIDAVNLMTDHVIERPPITGNVTGEAFRARLRPLSAQLVERAAQLHDEAQSAYDALPQGPAKASLAPHLALARDRLDQARGALANESAYTAASFSFQSSLEGRCVRDVATILAAGGSADLLQGRFDEAEQAVSTARGEVDAFPVATTMDFEPAGAAQVRVLEAEERLASARALAADASAATPCDPAADPVYQAGYALERAETARWWLRLSEGLPEGTALEEGVLEEIAVDTLTTSRETVAYVQAVFSARGFGADVSDPLRLLASADAAMARGYTAGAMLLGLEASVRAGILLEILGSGGDVPPSKVEAKREAAARAIQAARERGAEPLLAQSEYEFGLSPFLETADRLTFLGLARVTANLAGLPGATGTSAQPPQSRFQEIPASLGVPPVWIAAAFAVGLALGVGSGLTALMARDEDEARPATEPPLEGRDWWAREAPREKW